MKAKIKQEKLCECGRLASVSQNDRLICLRCDTIQRYFAKYNATRIIYNQKDRIYCEMDFWAFNNLTASLNQSNNL